MACGDEDEDAAGVDAREGSCRLPKEAICHGSEGGGDKTGEGVRGRMRMHLASHRTCAYLPRRARRDRRRGGSLSRGRPGARTWGGTACCQLWIEEGQQLRATRQQSWEGRGGDRERGGEAGGGVRAEQ